MILADTSVWVDHLRKSNAQLRSHLQQNGVLAHPFVIGELAMGVLKPCAAILSLLENLPQATLAHHHEVLALVSKQSLFGLGIGYIDAHLLASVYLTPHATFWTRDLRLQRIAARSSIAYVPA